MSGTVLISLDSPFLPPLWLGVTHWSPLWNIGEAASSWLLLIVHCSHTENCRSSNMFQQSSNSINTSSWHYLFWHHYTVYLGMCVAVGVCVYVFVVIDVCVWLFSCSFNTAKVLSIQKQNKTKHFHGVDSKRSETISK